MIIAICGPKGSGKDTAANFLKEITNNQFEICKFVQPMIDKIKFIYDLQSDDEYDTFKRSEFQLDGGICISGRRVVRETGMLMRELDIDFGIKHITKKISENDNIIISDLRMENEFQFLQRLGSMVTVVRIVPYNFDAIKDSHVTESSTSEFTIDYIVRNDFKDPSIMIKDLKEVIYATYYKSEVHN